MNRHIRKSTVACALSFVLAGTSVYAAGRSSIGAPDSIGGEVLSPSRPNPNTLPFKLKGGGQIDLATFTFSFAGQATHLGQFTAIGQLNPATGLLEGTITAANGDTVNWSGAFQPGPLGEFEATLTFAGGTGRFEHFDGVAGGPVALDPDYMFTMNLEGTVRFADPTF